MHPTDTLLSLSHARIARAAAAGPRRATQPTAMSNAQHLAQREQVWLRMHYTVGQPVKLPASQAGCDQWTTYRFSGTILQLRAASDADSDLAQQIDAL